MFITASRTSFAARSRRAVFVALVAVGVSPGVASASAEPSKPVVADPAPFSYASAADRERMERQAPLIAAAEVIRSAAEQDGNKDAGSGFTSVALGEDSVILTWKGGVPRAVRAAVEEARRDVPVEVKPAKHSKTELEAAEKRIREEFTRGVGPGFSMELPADGSGIVLNTEGDVEDAKRKVPDVGMSVTVKYKKNPKPASRLADSAPWWGGARILNAQLGAGCTSGFGVQNSYGSRFIVTAGHCGGVGNDWYNGNWTRYIGMAYSKHTAYDIMLIPTNAGGRIYDGGVGTNEFSKDVVGAGQVFMGEWLCTSGSVSGAVCGFVVNNFTFSYCGYAATGVWNCFSDLSTAPQKDGVVGVRSGDSGGPVFNLSGPNVIAKGVISGQANGGRTLIFQDWGTIVAVWPGLSPL
jgi:hypothetical protein